MKYTTPQLRTSGADATLMIQAKNGAGNDGSGTSNFTKVQLPVAIERQ